MELCIYKLFINILLNSLRHCNLVQIFYMLGTMSRINLTKFACLMEEVHLSPGSSPLFFVLQNR